MLKLIKSPGKNAWGAYFIIIRTLGGLAVQKLIALFYGPSGTVLFSHFQNFISLFTQPIQDIVAHGTINAYPRQEFLRRNLYITVLVTLLLVFISTLIILWLTESFPTDLLDFTTFQWILIVASILLLCFQSIATAILIAQKRLKLLSLAHLAQWLILLLVLGYLDQKLLNTLLYYLVILALFTLVLYSAIYKELKKFRLWNFSIDHKIINHFKQFLWMGLAIWVSSKWIDFFMREFAINLFGQTASGYWQAVVRISEAYRGLFISFLMVTFYPVVSHLFTISQKSVKSYLQQQMRPYFILNLLFFLAVFFFHPYILELLYSKAYLDASPLFSLQIIGDVFAFLSFPLALLLMAAVRTKAYVICELSSALIYILCIYWGSAIGITILVWAHIIRFIFYFILVLFFTHKTLKVA